MTQAILTYLFIFWNFFILSSASASYVYAGEFDRPNVTVLEMQLKENETLVFGEVESILATRGDKNNTLKGFQFFQVTLKVSEIWSKTNVVPKEKYQFVFGTMVDDINTLNAIPIKYKEKLAVATDSYRPNEVRMLKDHLLNIYERQFNPSNGKEYFISKLTKHYSQRNLVLSDLQRVAFTEKMHIYDLSKGKDETNTIQRSIASELTTPVDDAMADDSLDELQGGKIKRQPNSISKIQEEEVSVFSLLIVLISLGIFSHFVIKYYEAPEEEL